jgi:hypothetical protein
MKNLHFLLGAGASAFAQPRDQAPPLGDDLFEALANRYDGWASLPVDAKNKFKGTDGGFEHAMSYVRDNHDHLSAKLLCEMAIFFLSFEITPECHYHRLVRWATSISRDQVWLSTLNYDTLIEQAFLSAGIDGAPLKLHGCPTFAPYFGINNIRNIAISGGVHFEGPVKRLEINKASEYWAEAIANRGLGPAMALYAPNKPVLYCRKHTEEIQENWSARLRSADRVFIAGVRCTEADKHIWEPLANSAARLTFINPCETDLAAFADWAQRERPDKTTELGRMTFDQLITALERGRVGDSLRRVP